MTDPGSRKVLVVGVGNVLRRDDGFGVAVADQLVREGELPVGVKVLETGIGGMSIVQELMDGYQILIVADTVDRGEPPGTISLVRPDLAADGQANLSDLHLAEPSRVLGLAKALGVLPDKVLLVGCQPADCDGLGQVLCPDVGRAVGRAANLIRDVIASLTTCAE